MQDFDGWMAGLDGGEFQSLSRHVLKHPYEVFHVVIDEHTAQSVARCEESLGCAGDIPSSVTEAVSISLTGFGGS
ncbi:hypothetical protein VTP01DRAFT_10035 [Rhizomucor pusillus]|uniref:uncharacterized protein n=1 Tax=Rhizomucor pusillus TaxID=4840 RepID=UPI00374324EA